MRFVKKAFAAVAGVMLGGVVGAVGSSMYVASELGDNPESSAFYKGAKKWTETTNEMMADGQADQQEAEALVAMIETDPDVQELMTVSKGVLTGVGTLALLGGIAGATLVGRKKKEPLAGPGAGPR